MTEIGLRYLVDLSLYRKLLGYQWSVTVSGEHPLAGMAVSGFRWTRDAAHAEGYETLSALSKFCLEMLDNRSRRAHTGCMTDLTVSELVLLACRANETLEAVANGLPHSHPLGHDVVTIMQLVALLVTRLDRANETFVAQIPIEFVVPTAPPMSRSWDCI